MSSLFKMSENLQRAPNDTKVSKKKLDLKSTLLRHFFTLCVQNFRPFHFIISLFQDIAYLGFCHSMLKFHHKFCATQILKPVR